VSVETHGGHLGYLSQRATPLGTHRWLDWAVHQHLVAFDRLLGGDS
jgi:predicted alpha/beta-fold hydrolase